MRISEIVPYVGYSRPAVFSAYLIWINGDETNSMHLGVRHLRVTKKEISESLVLDQAKSTQDNSS